MTLEEYTKALEKFLPLECIRPYYNAEVFPWFLDEAKHYWQEGVSPKEASENIYADWAYEYYHNDGEFL